MMKKVSFPIDKRQWHPSLIPAAVVLIGTNDAQGMPNLAPKSWIQMVSFEPSVLMFSGTIDNPTEQNILFTRGFTVNTVDSSQAKTVYGCLQWHGRERIEKMRMTVTPAKEISAPVVDQCRAHLECKLIETKQIGSGFVIFGEIIAAAIDKNILTVEPGKRYELLDQIVFLENKTYARIHQTKRII